MNSVAIIHKFLIDYFSTDDLVNTVTLRKTSEIDENLNNIYQLVNLDMISSNVDEQVITFDFTITALQQRDTIPKVTDNKLLTDTNYLSNMGETHFVLSRFLNYLNKNDNDYLIDSIQINSMRPLSGYNRQNLDGWQVTVQFELPNLLPSC